jgi:hypothetical protein
MDSRPGTWQVDCECEDLNSLVPDPVAWESDTVGIGEERPDAHGVQAVFGLGGDPLRVEVRLRRVGVIAEPA